MTRYQEFESWQRSFFQNPVNDADAAFSGRSTGLRAPWFFRLVVSPLLPFGVNWFGQKKCWMIFSLCRLMADYKPSLSCKPFLCPPVQAAFFFPHLLRLANLRFATVFAKARDNIFPIPPSIPSPRTSEAGPRKCAHASLSQPLKQSRPFSIDLKRAWARAQRPKTKFRLRVNKTKA